MAYMTVRQYGSLRQGRNSGLQGLAGRVKWSGGKAGDVDERGVTYGMSDEEAAPIIAEWEKRKVAAAAGYATVEEYLLAKAREDAIKSGAYAPAPVPGPEPVPGPAPTPAPQMVESPPVAVPMPVEGAPAEAGAPAGEAGTFTMDWKIAAAAGAAILGGLYLFTRKKGR